MKKTLSILLILLLKGSIFGQCTYKDIFPVQHGTSRFEATRQIETKANFAIYKHVKKISKIRAEFKGWEKPAYLAGDSVYISYLHYKYLRHKCFNGELNRIYYGFVNDHLYKIGIDIFFKSDNFSACKNNYDLIADILKEKWNFPFAVPIKITHNKTNELIGKGYNFFPGWKRKGIAKGRNKIKTEKVSISYQSLYDAGNLRGYKINIVYVNLKDTKLTSASY